MAINPESFVPDYSKYGITGRDLAEWETTRQAFRKMSGFPEALRDKTKSVTVLNLYEDYTKYPHQKGSLRLICGNIDGVLNGHGDKRKEFDRDFPSQGTIDGKVFTWDRISVRHLPEEFFALTKKPTKYEHGRYYMHDLPPSELIKAFGLETEALSGSEIVLIPLENADIDPYVEAIREQTGITPHIAQVTYIMFGSDTGSWTFSEYEPGIPNINGNVCGAL